MTDAPGNPSGPSGQSHGLSPTDQGALAPETVNPAGGPPSKKFDLRTTHLWQVQFVRDLLIIGVIVGLVYLGYLVRVVTIPMLLALLLAYLFEPLVRKIVRKRIASRPAAAVAIIVVAGSLFLVPLTLAVTMAIVEGAAFAQHAAQNLGRIQKSVANPQDLELRANIDGPAWVWVRDYIVKLDREVGTLDENGDPVDPEPAPESAPDPAGAGPVADSPPAVGAEQPLTPSEIPDGGAAAPQSPLPEQARGNLRWWEQTMGDWGRGKARTLSKAGIDWLRANAEEIATAVGKHAIGTGATAIGAAFALALSLGFLLFTAFLTAFFFFYFCTGWGKLQDFWESLIPERKKGRVVELVHQMDAVIAGFVRGRLTIVGILMLFMTVAYMVIGVPAWYIVGPVVGALFIIPYVHIIGVPVAMALMALDTSGSLFAFQREWWWIVFAPIGVYTGAQLFDDYLLSPTIQGKNTNLDTPTILFASIAGGALAGVYGLLIAIPVAACIKIILKEVFWPRFRRWAQGEARDFLPIGTGTLGAETVVAPKGPPGGV